MSTTVEHSHNGTRAISCHGPYALDERDVSDSKWVGIRARGAEWSWLTEGEAVTIARAWLARYAPSERFGKGPEELAKEWQAGWKEAETQDKGTPK